jgi:tetraacyldisaccharide 4'-kinase
LSFNSNPKVITPILNKYLTILLFPFAILYNIVTRARNIFYDLGIFKSSTSSIKTICVGNIRVGGTGKSPFVEYLLRYSIKGKINAGTLSRGYGRKTKGFIMASETTMCNDIGDESFQYYKKFGDKISVFVDEKRVHGVDQIKNHDAYQHRSFTSNYNILLTEYTRPFFNDFLLPIGRLREARIGTKRADCIIVTKCPANLPTKEEQKYTDNINKYIKQNTPIFFTTIAYSDPIALFNNSIKINTYKEVVIICGIDNPMPFVDYCKKEFNVVDVLIFPDHHDFDKLDIDNLTHEKYKDCAILTTEKDTSRILLYTEILESQPIFYLPIEVKFIEKESEFVSLLDEWINV